MSGKKINWDKIGKGISSTGTYIAENKKPLLYIGGAIAIVVVGYAITRRAKKAVTSIGKDIIEGNFVSQSVDMSKATITKEQAKNYAEALYTAFINYWGTDNTAVRNVFDRINSEDYKMIHNEFGVRSRGMIDGKEPTGVEKWLGIYKDLDLIGWLNAELSVTDFLLKGKVRKVVEPAGFILS
jgi:hypothetical protein